MTMILPRTIFAKHPDVACRTVDGRALAIRPPLPNQPPILLTFNETGTIIWDLLDGQTDVTAILARLATLYPDLPAERRETETLALLEQLLAAGVVTSQHEATA